MTGINKDFRTREKLDYYFRTIYVILFLSVSKVVIPMGKYVNPKMGKFQRSLNSKIYVDKSELIAHTNELFFTEDCFICISRPRRFGKTMAANMLAAYYSRGIKSNHLFDNLKIANDESYEEHLNQHDTLMVNMQSFLSKTETVSKMLEMLQFEIITELKEIYPDVKCNNDLTDALHGIYAQTDRPFVILIDEWDCLFREYKDDNESQRQYLDFLRLLFKDQAYIGLAYMTGILPIKKYGTHSALNMFDEYSMADPFEFANYFGFTDDEVGELCAEFKMDVEEVRAWYNGYFVEMGTPIYNPKSVARCMKKARIGNYWIKTETYESIQGYIKLDFAGLQGQIMRLIAGEKIKVNTNKFANDMSTFNSTDDVLTLLLHLGYLTYDWDTEEVRIPNEEVKQEFVNSIEDLEDWSGIVGAIHTSESLLQAIWNMDSAVVADGVQRVHEQNASLFEYNDENSLSCVLNLALYSASNYYSVFRELPSGKGFADLVFIPRRKFNDKPAMVVELKWNETVQGAITQIKERSYVSALEEYQGNLLLVGISYSKKSKTHECKIESLEYGESG